MRVYTACPECGVDVTYVDRGALCVEGDGLIRCPEGHVVHDRREDLPSPEPKEGDGSTFMLRCYDAADLERLQASENPPVKITWGQHVAEGEVDAEIRAVLFGKVRGKIEIL